MARWVCEGAFRKSGFSLINLDPTKTEGGFHLNENDSLLVFGRDCHMISTADIVIVNLTDDISVGGAQEMLIAKYFNKLLIGVAPKGGKFNKDVKEFLGNTYTDWIHPFVAVKCDAVVTTIDECAEWIQGYFGKTRERQMAKGISIIDSALAY